MTDGRMLFSKSLSDGFNDRASAFRLSLGICVKLVNLIGQLYPRLSEYDFALPVQTTDRHFKCLLAHAENRVYLIGIRLVVVGKIPVVFFKQVYYLIQL